MEKHNFFCKYSEMRFIEAHSGISAKVINSLSVKKNKFDGIWASSLTISAMKGFPDIELDCLIDRFSTINDICSSSSLPVIVDFDTGGPVKNFKYICRRLEDIGVAGVIIEDKCGDKINSLIDNAKHILEDKAIFAKKIKEAKSICKRNGLQIFARLESLIAGYSIGHAIERAICFLKAGADGILIHSNKKSPNEIFDFIEKYNQLQNRKLLICVPTTYNNVTAQELFDRGVNIVIYANHLMRASIKAMESACLKILEKDRGFETDQDICCSIKELINLTEI